MYIYIHIYTFVYIYTYTHKYTCIYIYIYIIGNHGLFLGNTQGPYPKQNHVSIWCLSDLSNNITLFIRTMNNV